MNTENAFLRHLRNDANTFSGHFYGKSGQTLKVKPDIPAERMQTFLYEEKQIAQTRNLWTESC